MSVIRRIVVGSDGSARAQHAVAFAAELAHQLRAEVLLVHAAGEVAPARATASNYMLHVAKSDLYPEDSIERVVRTEWARPLIAARVPWGVDVRYGWGADVLMRVADEFGAQMIVIGAGFRCGRPSR
jgi:nucleotide-binding universal stress UspA family protein